MTRTLTAHGLVEGTRSACVATILHRFEEEILNYGSDAAIVLDAAARDPGCATAQAYAGALHLFRTTREGHARAAPFIAAARRIGGEGARERSMVTAVSRWAKDDFDGAGSALAAHVAREPGDLFAVKLLQYLCFTRGDAAGMLAAIETVIDQHRGDARAHGMRAFALDQCSRHDDAEAAARLALEIAPDPWAHHALAHVMDAQGRVEEGLAWMRNHAEAWSGCTSFLYTHNWWHAALFHLALGDSDGALALYHERVWAKRKDYAQDQVNAISLLARLELAGVDVGDRWHELADRVRPRASDALDGFLDLHYVYALARAGDSRHVVALLAALRDAIVPGAERWRQVALDAARGMAAFACGRFAEAAWRLGPIAADFALLGGSTVQRALFARVLAAARLGATARAA